MFGTSSGSTDRPLRVSGPTHLPAVDAPAFEAGGATNVSGDVEAGRIDCSGATRVGGDLSGTTVEAAGFTGAGGDLLAETASLSGAVEVAGTVEAAELSVGGSFSAAAVEGGTVEAGGTLSADRVDVDELAVGGGVRAGRVAADAVDLRMGGAESVLGTVVAENVTVARESGRGSGRGSGDGRLTVERVEATRIDVEHTDADELVGERVVVGPGSRVGTVRAPDVEVDDDAEVGRIERPE